MYIINLVERMYKKISKLVFPLVLILISAFLCFRNYTPNTYLIGWDSLHPEFNFPEAASRIWSGVWRGEQGVGAIAAHGDTADFPHAVLTWLFSFVLPVSFLRYSYIFLCLIFGTLGMYFFLKYIFQTIKSSDWVYPSAFLGALFYLLNLGTVQNFYVPLEMFTAAFALLPWLFCLGLKYLQEGKRKNLIFFCLSVIFSSPMAYAATLWYASFAGLFVFIFFYSLISPTVRANFKRFLALTFSTVLLNLYWILPNIYSIVNQSKVISNSNINRLFSPEAFLRNADYGDFKDVILQKNFLFGWLNFDFADGKFINLMSVWIKHLSSPHILILGYGLSAIAILGLIFGILKREKVVLALIPTLLFTLFFLFNINPPLGSIYGYLYSHYGVFAEGFRMPFTKFSIIFEVLMSFCFGYFIFLILALKTWSLKVIRVITVFVKISFFLSVITAIIYFMLPAFNGWLIGPNVRKALPVEYMEMFNWFNTNSYGRIALMPINSKYGWEYRDWGYEGSGFLTYGIASPVLYRDFDRWNSANEDFFNQESTALYSNDNQAFIDTLKKYQVKYILLDESIINAGGGEDLLRVSEIKDVLSKDNVKQVAKFGFLTVFETGYGADISTPSNFVQTDFDLSYSPVDPIYAKYGDYINTGKIKLARGVPSLPSTSPAITEDLSVNRGFKDAYNCDLRKVGSVFKNNSKEGILYRAENGGVSCDYLNFPSLSYNQAYVLRIAGENKEGRSLKIYLFNQDAQIPEIEEILPSGNFDQNYLIYPKAFLGLGYILSLETRSFGRIPSENLLTRVEFYPVDYEYLTIFKGETLKGVYSIQNNLKVLSVKKFGTWVYKVDVHLPALAQPEELRSTLLAGMSEALQAGGYGLIQLGQGYDTGWIALQIQNSKFKIQNLEHVKVNSWANGWTVDNSTISNPNSVIWLIYWPQALEWGGAVVGVTTLLFLILKKR